MKILMRISKDSHGTGTKPAVGGGGGGFKEEDFKE